MSALLFLVSVAPELRGREGNDMGHGRGTGTSRGCCTCSHCPWSEIGFLLYEKLSRTLCHPAQQLRQDPKTKTLNCL